VPLRLELGTRELASGACTLAASGACGVGPEAVQRALSAAGGGSSSGSSRGPSGVRRHSVPAERAPEVSAALLAALPAGGQQRRLCPKLHLASPEHPAGLCPAHARHQARAGRACHCGQGHLDLPGLKQLVQPLYEQQAGARVEAWLHDGPGPPGRAATLLLVANIPEALGAKAAAAALPFSARRVRVARGAQGRCRGFVHVALADPSRAEAAEAATDGRLELGGAVAAVSRACGRGPAVPLAAAAGALQGARAGSPPGAGPSPPPAPPLAAPGGEPPLRPRCPQVRIDSVAAYSVTDQYTADQMTELLAAAAEALCLPGASPAAGPLLPLAVTAAGGRVVVHQGDYTALASQLQQQVVFIDPPWGRPQYSSAAAAAATATPIAAAEGSSLAAEPEGSHQAPGGSSHPIPAASSTGVHHSSDLALGGTSLVQLCTQLCTQLCSSGAARVVGIKVPATLDVAAMCARIRTSSSRQPCLGRGASLPCIPPSSDRRRSCCWGAGRARPMMLGGRRWTRRWPAGQAGALRGCASTMVQPAAWSV
jgi:hypothetical protein